MKTITQSEIIKKLIADYHSQTVYYNHMLDYYNGNHDIYSNYQFSDGRANDKVVQNFVGRFCEEEIAYIFGNPVSYVSKSGDENIVNTIDYNLYHWKTTHNQELCRQLEIFGTAYELYFINEDGLFSARILNPTNSIAYTDSDGKPQIFIHFYKLKYDDAEYYDVYYTDRIEVYKNNTLLSTKKHIFGCVPVSICSIGTEQTIFNKIKTLNDAYNSILSDQKNTISDNRNAYLVISGMQLNEETSQKLKTHGILNIEPKDGKAEWLIKNVDSSYIESILKELRDDMYSVCSHVDGNEKLQSNTSGVALRTRLVFLEQRCKTVFDAVCDTIYDRLKFLFEYLEYKNNTFDWKDITISFNPNIPQDLTMIAQVLTQLDGKISLETALAQVPFVENPANEIAKLKKERGELAEIDLDKINAV